MSDYRRIREHEPKPLIFLILDVLSLLPIYETHLLIKAASRESLINTKLRDALKIQSLLRYYTVFLYFSKQSYSAGVNNVFIVSSNHFLKLIILTQLIGAIWYNLKCWKCERKNWTVNMRDFHFNEDDPLSWAMICYYTIGNLLMHSWSGK